MTLDQSFVGRPDSRAIFDALVETVRRSLGDFDLRISKSQVGLARGRIFARVWVPARHLGAGRGAPLVMTLGFRAHDPSPRWKEVVEPNRGRFTHHLELWCVEDIDAEVLSWVRKAVADTG